MQSSAAHRGHHRQLNYSPSCPSSSALYQLISFSLFSTFRIWCFQKLSSSSAGHHHHFLTELSPRLLVETPFWWSGIWFKHLRKGRGNMDGFQRNRLERNQRNTGRFRLDSQPSLADPSRPQKVELGHLGT